MQFQRLFCYCISEQTQKQWDKSPIGISSKSLHLTDNIEITVSINLVKNGSVQYVTDASRLGLQPEGTHICYVYAVVLLINYEHKPYNSHQYHLHHWDPKIGHKWCQ